MAYPFQPMNRKSMVCEMNIKCKCGHLAPAVQFITVFCNDPNDWQCPKCKVIFKSGVSPEKPWMKDLSYHQRIRLELGLDISGSKHNS